MTDQPNFSKIVPGLDLDAIQRAHAELEGQKAEKFAQLLVTSVRTQLEEEYLAFSVEVTEWLENALDTSREDSWLEVYNDARHFARDLRVMSARVETATERLRNVFASEFGVPADDD